MYITMYTNICIYFISGKFLLRKILAFFVKKIRLSSFIICYKKVIKYFYWIPIQ